MNYEEKVFNNLDELEKYNSQLALELKSTFKIDDTKINDWINNKIFVYPSFEDYAKYELVSGVYSDIYEIPHEAIYFNDIPDPLDYIDLYKLGKNLIANSGDTYWYVSSNEEVVLSTVGWYE